VNELAILGFGIASFATGFLVGLLASGRYRDR
jgi:hypothetical protein